MKRRRRGEFLALQIAIGQRERKKRKEKRVSLHARTAGLELVSELVG